MANPTIGKIQLSRTQQRIGFLDQDRVVTRVQHYSVIKENELVQYAAQSAHIPESALRNACRAVRQAVEYFVQNGHHVNLGKFGFLGIHINAKAVRTPEEVSASLIRNIRLQYRPSQEIREVMNNVSITNA